MVVEAAISAETVLDFCEKPSDRPTAAAPKPKP